MEALANPLPTNREAPRLRLVPNSNGHRPRKVSDSQRRHERELLRRYAATRSPELRERLVMLFAPLARSLAMRYSRTTEPLDDLVQVANLALVKAIDGFDPARERPFTAYAVPTILGELRRHFRDNVWGLHLPRTLQELTAAVEKATGELAEELGRFPTVAEIAAQLDVSEEEVLDALSADQARRTMSLDAPRETADGDAGTVVETVASHEPGYDRVEAELASKTAGLDEREWRVLRLRFVENQTQFEVSKQFDISQMQISRIQRQALRKLLAAVRGNAASRSATAIG